MSYDEDEDDCIVILPGDDVSLNDEYEDDNDEQGREKRTRMWAHTHQELLLSYMHPTMDAHGEALSLPQYLQV